MAFWEVESVWLIDQFINKLTASIRATVFDRIEIRTVPKKELTEDFARLYSDLLVRRSVFARAANPVINIGPKIGWKLDAWAKLREVFPNQIWTMSQAMALTVHLSAAVYHKTVSDNE